MLEFRISPDLLARGHCARKLVVLRDHETHVTAPDSSSTRKLGLGPDSIVSITRAA